jgi:Ser/Thr protein kinase RdoA (MazF antagonist)
MKIQSNLLFDKHTNELIGFVDLGDEDIHTAVFDTPTTLASHVLAFMVRGVASDLKYILGYFSTQSLTSFNSR